MCWSLRDLKSTVVDGRYDSTTVARVCVRTVCDLSAMRPWSTQTLQSSRVCSYRVVSTDVEVRLVQTLSW